MKFKRLALFMVAAVLACKPEPKLQEVCFRTNLVDDGVMTRSTDREEIQGLIASTYPSITPTLWYGDYGGESVDIILNTMMTVKVGTWLCSWSAPSLSSVADVFNSATFRLSPHMYINQNVTIRPSITNYVLDVNLYSSAFVWDVREVSEIRYNGKNESRANTLINFGASSDNYKCIFLVGATNGEGDILIFKITPSDENAKETMFYFSNAMDSWQGNPCHKIEMGHYYVLHPEYITDISGSFSVNIPAWECGLD